MIIINDLYEKSNAPLSVALGYFDGVHIGHQQILYDVVKDSKDGLIPSVFTFNKIPKFKKEGNSPIEILSFEDKSQIFKEIGIKRLYSINFEDIMNMDAETFVKDVLLFSLNAKRVYCGFNYKFSKGKGANAQDLKNLCEKYNIYVKILPPFLYNERVISSTLIRNYIKLGDMNKVNKLLGRYYSINKKVLKGNQIGRKIGFKTINQCVDNDLIMPRFGVYASFANINGKKMMSVTNVGQKPTFSLQKPNFETFILDYDGPDLYDQVIKVELVEFLRDEIKFLNLEDLKDQIQLDVDKAKEILLSHLI